MRTDETIPRVVEAGAKSGLRRIPSLFAIAFSFSCCSFLAVMVAQDAVERFHAHSGSTWWWVIFAVGGLFYLAYAIYCASRPRSAMASLPPRKSPSQTSSSLYSLGRFAGSTTLEWSCLGRISLSSCRVQDRRRVGT